MSKPEPNHPNHANHFLGQNPSFWNLLRGFDRHKEHDLKGYARTGICKILPFYRNMGLNFWCAKGLDRPEIGLHTKGLDQFSGVLFVIQAACVNACVVWMISDALICSLNMYYSWNWHVYNFGLDKVCHRFAYPLTPKPFISVWCGFAFGEIGVPLVCIMFASTPPSQ